MADEKKCFVIMPITTPAPMVEKYHDGATHFRHVYDCLFEPSIRKAGYTPIPPWADGSDLIHAGIIGNLESADLVLCDMSCLNPNVFFEWGIRTALNKPVCIVKDELTRDVPFDTTMLNYHPYSNTLHGWEIEAEREKLTAHLTTSAPKTGSENALWKYFGLSSKGRPYQVLEGSDGKIDYLTMRVESLAERMDRMASSGSVDGVDFHDLGLLATGAKVETFLRKAYPMVHVSSFGIEPSGASVTLYTETNMAKAAMNIIAEKLMHKFNVRPKWVVVPPQGNSPPDMS